MKIKLDFSIFYLLFAICTAMIGYNVNEHLGSDHCLFWSIMDFIFFPLAWIKWLICKQVTLAIIKSRLWETVSQSYYALIQYNFVSYLFSF